MLSGCATTEKQSVMPIEQGNFQAAQQALQLQGAPYVYGGASPKDGFDCSGLVVYVYGRQGVKLPRTALSLAEQLPDIHPDLRQPGDLLFFNTQRPYSHVGIYVGNDEFVHAPSARTGRVMVSSLRQRYWRERFMAVRRPMPMQTLSFSAITGAECRLN